MLLKNILILYITFAANDTGKFSSMALPVIPNVTGRCGAVTPTGNRAMHACVVHVRLLYARRKPLSNQLTIYKQNPKTMAVKIDEVKQQSFITYRIKGNSGDYLAQLHALTKAVANVPLNKDEQQTLSHLLESILPAENQLMID